MPILEVRGLAKTFGRRRVVNGVEFEIDRGELVGLLGPNGAGKTTSFRMSCGLVEPDEGHVWLSGDDVTHWPMHRRAREGGMGYLAQESSVFRKLTVEQNLLCMLELLDVKGREKRERCDELLDEFDISHIRKSRASKLSGGERRRLEFARCLIANPKIIMLDEPFAGIDPVTVQNIQKVIRRLVSQGIGIFITDHAAREILEIVDRCYVISEGSVLCHGSAADVKRHPEVRRKYLGNMAADDLGRAEPPSPQVPSPHFESSRNKRKRVRRRSRSIHEQDTLDADDQ
ncbi:MAG: LPS export ABC transporter ATP-binding protein [Pirellulaceae bacterium]|jgi:lipopolysaccharide export system ATP-binding protein|nr:LPS export ABC transporter ATP-binding protein [Pirellulaceae bacterium]MDP7016012.1 LPS export ABC transporter ATP-binding protein [Pirellulaceae bacterium]